MTGLQNTAVLGSSNKELARTKSVQGSCNLVVKDAERWWKDDQARWFTDEEAGATRVRLVL